MARLTFGIVVSLEGSLRAALAKAAEADRLRFDRIWLFDRVNALYPPAAAAAIAAKAKHARIGLGMSPLIHSPQDLASTMVALIQAYGERFDLCLIPGDRKLLSAVGIPAEKFKEFPVLLKQAGEAVKSAAAERGFNLQVWLGAQGLRLLKLAGSFDGVLLNMASPETVRLALEAMGGLPRHGFQLGVIAASYVYENFNADVQRAARFAAAVALRGAASWLKKALKMPGWPKPEEELTWTAVKSIPEGLLRHFLISMPVEQLEEYVSALRRAGVTHLAFSNPQDYSLETVREAGLALRRLHG